MKVINTVVQKVFDIGFFKLVFLISCFFYCIPFTNFLLVSVFKVFIFWGIAIFLYNYFCNKKYVLKKADYLLFGFLGLAALSCVFNFRQNLVQNVIAVAYLFVQTVLMVSYNRTPSLDQTVKEIKRFANAAVILTFPCAVISILIFLLNFKFSFRVGFQQYVFGVFEGRLWGIQGNPNTLAQFALVSIWLSIILLFINKKYGGKKGQRVFLYTNIVLQIICCVLSNSRSTTIGAAVAIGFLALVLIGLKKRKADQSVLKAILKNPLTTVLKLASVAICVVLVFVVVKQGMRIASIPFKNVDLDFLPVYEEETPEDTEENKTQNNINKTDREYLTDDYSNGRLEIWQGAAKVILKNPIFGVGVKNINESVNAFLSETTVAATPKLSENMHNIYIQVLVANGIVAFIFFVLYLTITVLKNIKFLFTFNSDDENNKFIFKLVLAHLCLIGGLLIINLFDSNLLYFCSIFMVPVFWSSISHINALKDSVVGKKKRVLFSISNLGGGGAEKVLMDITNNMNFEENEVEVQTIFNEGKYIKELNENIKYSYILKKPTLLKKRILSRVIKYFPKKFVYNFFIDKNYDVEIAFLESLPVKLLCGSNSSAIKVAWLHADIFSVKETLALFINKKRLTKCYQSFDRVVCVSDSVRASFVSNTKLYQNAVTIYNPIDKKQIIEKAGLNCDIKADKNKFTIVTVGSLTYAKGFLRLCQVIEKIAEKNKNIELWIVGEGPERATLESFINEKQLGEYIKLLGFKDNPYSYLNQADLFVSSSITEGYSLVLAEAMVLGIPVLSTNTNGPANVLQNGKYGCIVENSFEGLYDGIKNLIDNPNELNKVKEKVLQRQGFFKLEEKIEQVENLFKLKDNINKESDLFCTVFTPAYNRGYIIEKLYNSLKNQTCTDFEWVVVDDGSTDNTEELFKKWCKEENSFKINYIKVQNGGKQRAINKGVAVARGKMFFIVDSDDSLTENAVERLKFYEGTIKNYNNFAGISGLRGYNREKVIGERNGAEYVDAFGQEREKYNLLGDKAECYYTDLLKRYLFPEVIGEKFVTECIVWDKISFDGYKIRWFDEIIYLGEYLDDGYTSEGTSLFDKNPIGFLLYVRNEKLYFPLDIKKQIGNYYRYFKMIKESKSLGEISEDLLTSKSFIKLCDLLYNVKLKIKGR